MGRLYRFDGSKEFVQYYQQWDDARFLETFSPIASKPPGTKSGKMLGKLRERQLLKEVFRDGIGKPYDARFLEILKGLQKPNSAAVAIAVERRVAAYLTQELGLKGADAIDPDFVIAYSYSIKSARESSRNEEQGILVNVRPAPQYVIEESTLFKSINEAYSDNFIVIFAPIQWVDPTKKDDLRASWKDPIRKLIEEECKKVKP
jgi:hypothetical protein